MKLFFVGVKAVIIEERGIILLKRNEAAGGYWDAPGGRMDEGEQVEDTLKRELSEELLGIKITSIGRLLGVHKLEHDIKDNLGLMLLYYAATAILPEKISLGSDHYDHIWIKNSSEIPEGLNSSLKTAIEQALTEKLAQ